jgi:peroxiredoxin
VGCANMIGPPGIRRACRTAAAMVLTATTLTFSAASAGGPTSEELDPLLRALSARPWWGEPPPLRLPGLDGQRHSLAAIRGRVVLLYFWATWCPICTGELPSHIQSLHQELAGQGLTIWAISVRESPEAVTAWLRDHPVSLEILLDPDGAAAQSYRMTATPTFVLIDRNGQLVGRGVGSRDWSGDRGRALIQALLGPPGAGRPPASAPSIGLSPGREPA